MQQLMRRFCAMQQKLRSSVCVYLNPLTMSIDGGQTNKKANTGLAMPLRLWLAAELRPTDRGAAKDLNEGVSAIFMTIPRRRRRPQNDRNHGISAPPRIEHSYALEPCAVDLLDESGHHLESYPMD